MRPRRVGDDPRLPPWEEVSGYTDWKGLLVGNGGSITIWPQFAYSSLYNVATSQDVAHPLTAEDTGLFDAFGATNFERILASLKTAGIVGEALGLQVAVLDERYRSIQRALFEAVHTVHVPWDHVGWRTIPRLFNALREYKFVYSTNYDLLLYWASMENGGPGFLDYFWNDTKFDVSNTEIWPSREGWTRILFMHGGIHLRRLRGGGSRKVLANEGAILDQFETDYPGDESPLLISEGESDDKLSSIRTSDYLTFAHQTFAAHEGGLVVFGHSLGDQDDHLALPIRSWRGNPLAISMRPRENEDLIIQEKVRYRNRLAPMQDIVFFDATTHPLGDRDLAARARNLGIFRRG